MNIRDFDLNNYLHEQIFSRETVKILTKCCFKQVAYFYQNNSN
jgi:hypothetical protein